MVLIDPSFAGQDGYLTSEQRKQDRVSFAASLKELGVCAALARSGKLATNTYEACNAFAPNRSEVEKTYLRYQFTRPYRYEAMASELVAQHSNDGLSDTNSRIEVSSRRDWGNIPLVVLTAERAKNPNETTAQRILAEKAWAYWKAGHDRLAARSTIGKSTIVTETGHFIQIDQPDVVVDAVATTVDLARRQIRESAIGSTPQPKSR
ncbi:MAG: hypothetical protein JSR96_09145 [Proteobacteria bacterium]|nr:hypothetical protein [Pseudomonadota bacterium]